MMNVQLPEIYSVERILKQSSRDDFLTYDKEIWQMFVEWVYFQFQSNRHINFGNLGNFGFKTIENSNKKVPYFYFNENFTKMNQLTQNDKTFVFKPTTRINYESIAKNLNNKKVKSENVQTVIKYLIDFSQQSLKDKRSFIIIDFDILGRIVKKQVQIWFQYILSQKKSVLQRSSIRYHVEKQEDKFSNTLTLNKFNLLNTQAKFFPVISFKDKKNYHKQKQQSTNKKDSLQLTERLKTSAKVKVSQPFTKKKVSLAKISHQNRDNPKDLESTNTKKRAFSLKDLTKTNFNSFYKPQKEHQSTRTGWQMMAAGRDPFKKGQQFSKLINNTDSLLNTKFGFNRIDFQDNIPVIDLYARLKASPIAAQRQNLSIVGRIGCNYFVNSQKFQISNDGVKITTLKSPILVSPIKQTENIDRQIEYRIVMKSQRTVDQVNMIRNYVKSYERFLSLMKMIPDDHIVDFKGCCSRQFIQQLKLLHKKDNSTFYKVIHDIEDNHLVGVKRAILNYILIDPVERARLSIHQFQVDRVRKFGGSKREFLINDEKSPVNFIQVKQTLEKNLGKNNNNIVRIVKQWQDQYQNYNILSLPQDLSQYFTIDDICDRLRVQIKKFHTKTLTRWLPKVASIYRQQVSQVNSDMSKCEVFFRSAKTILEIKFRQLLFRTLQKYLRFFQIFDIEQMNPPDTVLHLQQTMGVYEMGFLVVRVGYRREEIYFMQNIDEIEGKLIEVMNTLRLTCESIPRPENSITNTSDDDGTSYLSVISSFYNSFTTLTHHISSIIQRTVTNTKQSIQIFASYTYLLSQQHRISQWLTTSHDRRQYSLTLTKYRKLYQQIMQHFPFMIRLNMICVDCGQLKRFILKTIQGIIFKVEKSVYELVMRKNTCIQQALDKIKSIGKQYIVSCQDLVCVEQRLQRFRRVQIKQLQKQHGELMKWMMITLYNTFYSVSRDDIQAIYITSSSLHNIIVELQKCQPYIFQSRLELSTHLIRLSQQLTIKSRSLVTQILKIKQFNQNIFKDSALQLLNASRIKLKQLLEEKRMLNQKQMLMGLEETELTFLGQWNDNLVPFEEFWGVIDDFSKLHSTWMREPIVTQSLDVIQTSCANMLKKTHNLTKNHIIKSLPHNMRMCQNLSQQIQQFMTYIPLISIFSNKSLRYRHKHKISIILGINYELQIFNSLNLQKLIGISAKQLITQLEEVSQQANRQYKVEKIVQRLKQNWEGVRMEFEQYKNGEILIARVESIEYIRQLVDDSMIGILSIKGTIYATVFNNELIYFQTISHQVADIINLYKQAIQLWIQLQPIMSSNDILKQLPLQGQKFKYLSQNFRDICLFMFNQNLLTSIIKSKQIIIKRLGDCIGEMEVVQKGLYVYMQLKRVKYGRLYLLSDNELLQMMRLRNDINSLQRYIGRCFAGIERIQIVEQKYITAMFSFSGQRVELVNPINYTLSRGNMDELFIQIENRMMMTVRLGIDNCHRIYDNNHDENIKVRSLKQQIGLAVVVVQLVRWSEYIENDVICRHSVGQMFRWSLQQLVKIKSSSYHFLANHNRITLDTLITLQLHHRQFQKLYQYQLSTDKNQFEWQSQLRYYYRSSDLGGKYTQLKVFDADFNYNYQYIGTPQRVVITPLTDRYRQHLCTIIYSNCLPLVYGPACVGKSSLIKDLALSFGYNIFQYNCSSLTSHSTFIRLLSGVIASGLWCSFYNLHLVNMKILSFVAQIFFELKLAKQNKLKGVIVINDKEVKIKKNAQVFVCVNDIVDYGDKCCLPQNLKSLYRHIQIHVPNIQVIASVKLFLLNFKDHQSLGRKLASSIKLIKHHYREQQLGYRCQVNQLTRIIDICREVREKYKRQFHEQEVIYQTLISLYYDRLSLTQQKQRFHSDIQTVFTSMHHPSIQIESPQQQYFRLHLLKLAIDQLDLITNSFQIDKIIQLHQSITQKKSVIIVGESLCGKSTTLQILRKALVDSGTVSGISVTRLNPKSVTLQQLLGSFQSSPQSKWQAGLLQIKIKQLLSIQPNINHHKWLIFDGPFDLPILRFLQYAFRDQRKLCFDSGQIVRIQEQSLKIMFECESLTAFSPSIIGRCAIIWFPSYQNIGYDALLKVYKRSIVSMGKYVGGIVDLFFQRIPQVYSQIIKYITIQQRNVSPLNIVSSFIKIFNYHITRIRQVLYISAKQKQSLSLSLQPLVDINVLVEIQISQHEKQIYRIVGSSFIYSLYHSFGLLLGSDTKKEFEVYLKRLVISHFSKTKNEKIQLPEQGTISQCFFFIDSQISTINGQWRRWTIRQQLPKSIPTHQIKVKTKRIIETNYLLSLYSQSKSSILIAGSSGTGKRTILSNYFEQKCLGQNKLGNIQIILSHGSKCNDIRSQLQANLQRKGSKHRWGPKNIDSAVVLVDDINMPKYQSPDTTTQLPIQLLLQLLKSGGFYHIKSTQVSFINLTGLEFIFTMNLNKNRQIISHRFFNRNVFLLMDEFCDEEIVQIFQKLLGWHFLGHSEQKNIKTILRHSVQIYQACVLRFNSQVMTETLQQRFNFKHLHSLLISICRADRLKVHNQNIGRLWAHEAKRVFRDSLSVSQKIKFDTILDEIGKKWGKNFSQTYFTQILSLPPERSYQEVNDIEKINLSVSAYLNDYNLNSQKPLHLILSKEFIEQILIAYRAITQPRGYFVLLARTGMGKKSITRLTAFVARQEVFQIQKQKQFNYNQLIQKLKQVFIKISRQRKQYCWILQLKQLLHLEIIEIVNRIIKQGTINNLFSQEEKLKLYEQMRQQIGQKNSINDSSLSALHRQFLCRVINKFKLIICLDPKHKSFQQLIKAYPSLMNNTIVNWLQEWPLSALVSVGNKILDSIQIKGKSIFIKALQYFYSTIKIWSHEYYEQYNKFFVITAKCYFNLVYVFRDILILKRRQYRDWIIKHTNVLKKIYQIEQKLSQLSQIVELTNKKITNLVSEIQLVSDQNVNSQSYEIEWKRGSLNKLQVEYSKYCSSYSKINNIVKRLTPFKLAWQKHIQTIKNLQQLLQPNVLLSAAQISFLGPFNQSYRIKIIQQWKDYLQQSSLELSKNFNLVNFLISSPLQTKEWGLNHLPNDNYFTENATIIQHSRKWPLLIDPEQQGIRWLKTQFISNKIKSKKIKQQNLLRELQSSIQFGLPFLIQSFQQPIRPFLYPVLFKQTFKKGSTTYVKLGQSNIIYSLNFRLFISTRDRNPRFEQQIYAGLSLIDFTLTGSALNSMIIQSIMQNENINIYQQRINRLKEHVQNQHEKFAVEVKLIQYLTSTKTSLCEDQQFVHYLTAWEENLQSIKGRQQRVIAKIEKVKQEREIYETLSTTASMLYLTVSSLVKVSYMYQYSLYGFIDFVVELFKSNIQSSQLKYHVYERINHSLHIKDRRIFAALLALSQQNTLNQLRQSLPSSQSQKLSLKQRMLFLPQKTKQVIDALLQKTFKKYLVASQDINFRNIVISTKPATPILMILTPNIDPLQQIFQLSGCLDRHLQVISLGLQNNQRYQKLIRQNIFNGGWVILQNCHLDLNFVSISIGKIVDWMENDEKQINSNFRLWMTTNPIEKFPQQILLKSSKILLNHLDNKQALQVQTSDSYSSQEFTSIVISCLSLN